MDSMTLGGGGSFFDNVPLAECIYLVFTWIIMPNDSYRWQFGSLLLCPLIVIRVASAVDFFSLLTLHRSKNHLSNNYVATLTS